jgi:hypothetical protein
MNWYVFKVDGEVQGLLKEEPLIPITGNLCIHTKSMSANMWSAPDYLVEAMERYMREQNDRPTHENN